MTDAAERLDAFKSEMGEFTEQAPAMGGFLDFVEAAEGDGALDHKTKELLSLAIGVVLRCEPCILWHTDAALQAGTTPEEVDEALTVAVVMGGGPAMAYATEAHQVLRALSE